MRFAYALASLAFLAACASGGASAPGASAPSSRASSGIAGMLASAGQSSAPSLAQIERTMGAADIRRQDGVGVALTYRMENCALLLLFAPTTGNEMRLAVAHPSARAPNQAAPSLEQCAGQARDRRS